MGNFVFPFCDFQENNDDKSPIAPLSTASEIQHLRDQLEQQAMQTREALFQLMQVREQLISETNARIEAQVRTQYWLDSFILLIVRAVHCLFIYLFIFFIPVESNEIVCFYSLFFLSPPTATMFSNVIYL